MASIFFNFGTDGATAGAKTYLWDDVAFGPAMVSITNPLESSVGIYPNPAKTTLYVTLPESLVGQTLSCVIMDMTGRLVKNTTLRNGQIEVANLVDGVYSLQIMTSNGVINKRFVKLQ